MTIAQEHPTLVGDFAEFLATLRTTDQIIQWRPSADVQRRIEDLLLRQNEGALESHEQRELESTMQAEMMLRLLKAKLMLASSKKRR